MPAAAFSARATRGELEDPGTRRPSSTVLTIVIVFVVSRAIAFALGLRFDDGLLHGAYQLLDVRLLRDDPFRSLLYLQSQPPLFNALVAIVVRLPHSFVNTTLMLVWHAASLATALLLYATAVRLDVRVWVAAAFACFFLLLPETLLVESWFFYSQLEMLLVALMMWGLARFASHQKTRDGLIFTGTVAALILLRSSWHILLMVLLIAMVGRQLHVDRRKLAAIAAIPLVAVAAWSFKNLVIFDSWSNSSWLGMNLSYVAHAGVSNHECRRLQTEHRVSSIACLRAFEPPPVYAGHVAHVPRFGARAADAWYKSTGQPNFNAGLYTAVSSQYQRDALTLLREGGAAAMGRAEAAAYTVWAEPGDDLLQLRRVRAPISSYADWFDRVVLLRPVASGRTNPKRFTADAGAFPIGDALGSISYTLLGLFGLAVYGGVAGWRHGRRGQPALQCVCAVGLIVIGYSVVIGNALDYRENNRFRVETSPVVLVLGAVGADRLWRAVAGRGSHGAADPDGTSVPVPTPVPR